MRQKLSRQKMLFAHMNAVIRAYDEFGAVIETHEPTGNFNEWL
jgi:hypothetical protein